MAEAPLKVTSASEPAAPELMEAEPRGALLARLVEGQSTGLLYVDTGGLIQLANPAVVRLLDLRGRAEGRPMVEVVHVAEANDAVQAALRGEIIEPMPSVVGDHDLLIEASPMAPGALLTVRDVTWQRAAERARTEFVANVSHELRTPIAVIRGFAETMSADKDRLPDDLVPMLGAIERNAARLGSLFDDLLSLYRIETRRRDLPRDTLVVAGVLQEASRAAMDRAEHAGIKLETWCPPELSVVSSREAIGTILANLIGNACKYTPRGGTVSVVGRLDGRAAVIDIVDTGVGIARHHHERIFERFYRVDDGRTRKVGGTGLGLAIAKHYAQAINASLSLRSEEGVGSTFSLRFPEAGPAARPRLWQDG